MNLVGNAIKYTKSGGTVEVGSERIDAKVRVWVKDNGVGMSSSLIKKLFERFSRGDDDYSRGQEGTGIGLAIVHQLVSLNNGMIEIDSIVGQGSVFSIIFPMTGPPKAVESVEDVLQPNPARLTGKTILVLDDDNQSLRIVKNTLEARGAKVLLSDSISAARTHIEQESVNLIITDISLGRECGVGFIEEIRTRLFDLPIIVLSGSAFEEDRRRAFEAGANDFVPKPFETRSLIAITAKLLGVG
jgi:CheY-like chemotaxis protein